MEINKNEFDVSSLLLDEIDKSILVHLGKNDVFHHMILLNTLMI